jgi:hypothetical protein
MDDQRQSAKRTKQPTGYMNAFMLFQNETTQLKTEHDTIVKRMESHFEKELSNCKKVNDELLEKLKAGTRNIAPTMYAEMDRLKSENSVQKEEITYLNLKLEEQCGKVVAEFAMDKFKAIRQRNDIERELWKVKDNFRSKESQMELRAIQSENKLLKSQLHELRSDSGGKISITATEYDKYQKLLASDGELEASYELFEFKDAEIFDLKARIESLETDLEKSRCDDSEHYEIDGEPKWRRFQTLYYNELEMDEDGNPILNASGLPIPIRVGLEKKVLDLEKKLTPLPSATG